MSYRCFSSDINLNSAIFHGRISLINRHDLRVRRRRSSLGIRCQFGFESFFNAIHSASPLDLIAPVFGLASAAAGAYFYRSIRPTDGVTSVGDWILLTSLMPFNRCVLLRCPSFAFENGSELINGVNDRLLHLNRGKIPLKNEGDADFEKDVKFQRVCVRTEDGGMISLDWPDYLDLELEQGLDTTVLIIAGTAEGSMDRKVRLFVRDAVKHGCFPVVMNPRGCAGSPLTTARLFTAADSEDVGMAARYVSGLRPWATLMGIGWGYGANMLTKYLAESKERTPISAAACIDTPFDLNESMRSASHHATVSEKLLSGLKEILDANKELFQGKSKGFDVAKALSATSIRDFDSSISMVSYGFESLEDFYTKSNTGHLIGNLKIPILFTQSDDGTVPLLSIPHKSITDNPFTSLIICSCSHLTSSRGAESALLWSQQLAIELNLGSRLEFGFNWNLICLEFT